MKSDVQGEKNVGLDQDRLELAELSRALNGHIKRRQQHGARWPRALVGSATEGVVATEDTDQASPELGQLAQSAAECRRCALSAARGQVVFGVGDPQAVDEFGTDLHALQHGADLRPAAVDDDRQHAGLAQQADVLRERPRQCLIAHGMAAIFDDDGALFVALHVGQGFGQDPGLIVCRDAVLVCHSRSVSHR